MRLWIYIGCLLLSFLSTTARAEEMRLAVLDFQNEGNSGDKIRKVYLKKKEWLWAV